ncbi:MAG: hypothetical protein FJ010_03095 [Chloroflexi bacterium]|nr:hypothetical protein [Chloroflexota bacterium]
MLLAACQTSGSAQQSAHSLANTYTPVGTTTQTDIWNELLGHTPVPWTTPLPPLEATPLDATYVKVDPRLATPFPCKRCPDYALEGGLWKLNLDKGIYRIYYTVNGWRSLGSYTVSEGRLYLFNDPYCHRETGIYAWKLKDGVLTLAEIDDPCSQGLRAANLTHQPWLSCRPRNLEAMISDHWQKPQGCDPNE